MIEQDFIMLIMNCKKYANKAQFQKNTWLPGIPSFLRYYHVIGDETLDAAFKFDETNNVLWVRVADDYNSLRCCPRKAACRFAILYWLRRLRADASAIPKSPEYASVNAIMLLPNLFGL